MQGICRARLENWKTLTATTATSCSSNATAILSQPTISLLMVPALLVESLFPAGGILHSRGRSPTIPYYRVHAGPCSPLWCLRALRAVGRLAQLLGAVTGNPEHQRDNSSLIKLKPLGPTAS